MIVVARANLTDRTALSRALELLRRASTPMLGLVLNEVDDSASDYYPNQDYLPQPRT